MTDKPQPMSAQQTGPEGEAVGAVQSLRTTPAWSATAGHAQMLLAQRRRRKRGFFLRLGLLVGLPTLLTLLYTLCWASPRYVSEFEVTYQTYRAPQSLSSGLMQSVAGTAQSNSVDLASIIYQYVRSPALLRKLDAQLDLRRYFSRPQIDVLSRLPARASDERFLNYFRWQVSVSEGLGGFLTIDAQAFDPQFAARLAAAVSRACDEMIDQMTARARSDEIRVAEAELAGEELRVRNARLALARFQDAHGDLDPQRAAGQLGGIVGGLESDLAAARAQLANNAAYLNAASPIMQQLKSRVAALEQQLRAEKERLAGSSGGTAYSSLLEQYAALQLEEEFAKSAYQAAQQGLAVARADAARQENYLVDFAPPGEPDQPTVWFPITYTATVFVGTLLALGFGSLVVGAFRDQAGF